VQQGSDWVQKYIVYGDMGRHGGGMILQMVENEIALGDTTAIIHNGWASNENSAWGVSLRR
jgi:hypothetical protein